MLRYTVTVVTSMVKTDQTKRETRSIREVTTEGSKLLSLMKVQNEFVRFNLCRNTNINALGILKYYNKVLPMS